MNWGYWVLVGALAAVSTACDGFPPIDGSGGTTSTGGAAGDSSTGGAAGEASGGAGTGGSATQPVQKSCTSDADCSACETCSDSLLCTPKAAGTVCRPAEGSCDKADTCDGVSGECRDDLLPKGQMCRTRSTSTACNPPGSTRYGQPCAPCDADDFCDGVSKDCEDNVAPAGTMCRGGGDICDRPDYCNGITTDCPNNQLSVGTLCRPSTGPCDKEEVCEWSIPVLKQNPYCPEDKFQGTGVSCTPEGDPLTRPCAWERGFCAETSNSCIIIPRPKGYPCRPATSTCDAAEVCDGKSDQCPPDTGDSLCSLGALTP